MPRLVRRRPLLDRLKDCFDVQDLLLQLSERLNDDTYDEWLQVWATHIGVAFNILFILAKLAGKPSRRARDDVFGDYEGKGGSGWFSWMAAFLTPLLVGVCILNTAFTFLRKRQYRLFEHPVEETPITPSARLVRVDSSPASSSPLRYLQRVLSDATSGSRPHVDPEREVWEIAMWDPKPTNLTLFTLFSPGHLAVYYSMLPPAPLDNSPTLKVALAAFFGILLSIQLSLLRSCFTQQAKDSSFVHGQVMNEYDNKFVRPSLNRPVRDVATQTRESALTPRGTKTREVDVYTPTTFINRGFHTNPNPNYAKQYDPDNLSNQSSRRTSDIGTQPPATPSIITPSNPFARTNGYTSTSRPTTAGTDLFSSPLKPHHERPRPRSPIKNDGGYLGVQTHAASPLRKAVSSSYLGHSSSTSRDAGSQVGRTGTPLKRTSMSGAGLNGGGLEGGRRRDTGRY